MRLTQVRLWWHLWWVLCLLLQRWLAIRRLQPANLRMQQLPIVASLLLQGPLRLQMLLLEALQQLGACECMHAPQHHAADAHLVLLQR